MDKSYLHEVGHTQTEIGLGIDYGDEENFDDVTFLVSNEGDPQKAVDRVWKFIRMLVAEVNESEVVPPLDVIDGDTQTEAFARGMCAAYWRGKFEAERTHPNQIEGLIKSYTDNNWTYWVTSAKQLMSMVTPTTSS